MNDPCSIRFRAFPHRQHASRACFQRRTAFAQHGMLPPGLPGQYAGTICAVIVAAAGHEQLLLPRNAHEHIRFALAHGRVICLQPHQAEALELICQSVHVRMPVHRVRPDRDSARAANERNYLFRCEALHGEVSWATLAQKTNERVPRAFGKPTVDQRNGNVQPRRDLRAPVEERQDIVSRALEALRNFIVA
ncbi:hypothetical protein SDC9_148283 [bioreactor metagenome]|uniref:Uncharacterized protein n=1 Tax=bioreactor metagenome TaxID=1076179 RepID=A0A645EKK1_9ZZZZ